MGKIKHYTGNVLIALFLSAVLTCSILIKPVHILFVHHDHSELNHACFPQKVLSTIHDTDCSICNFEFCSFIPQKQVALPQVNIFSLKEPATRTDAYFYCNYPLSFQLRAPPVI